MFDVNNSKIEDSVMPLEARDLPQAQLLELVELEDLLQMIISNQNPDLAIYHIERGGDHLYLIWIVIHDFYSLNGLPLVIFVRTNQKPTRLIKFRPDLGRINFVEKVEESSAGYIKIVKIKQLPFCLELS